MEREISNAASSDALAPIEGIKELIFTVRGVQVMLDRDLARLYQVETRVLNQAVKRNINRFPERFMFQLMESEWDILKSQIMSSDMSSQFVTTSLEKRPNSAFPFAKVAESLGMVYICQCIISWNGV